jgi:hypothetical protein
MLQPNCISSVVPALPSAAANAVNSAALAVEAAKTNLELNRPKMARIWKRMPLLAATLAYGAPASATSAFDHPFVNEHTTYFAYDLFEQPVVDLVSVGSSEDMSGLSNWVAAWASGDRLGVTAPAHFAQILREIADLEDGWNGEGSQAPNAYVKNDLQILAQSFSASVRQPEVEVDDDGSIALRWEGDQRVVALTINGNGRVIGTMVPRSASFPCELAIRDANKLSELLSIDEVKSSIA